MVEAAWIDKAVENYRQGLHASAPRREATRQLARDRAAAQREVSKANRAASLANPCVVPGCNRARHKGRLCRAHWQEVPWQAKTQLATAVMDAQIKTAARHHRKIERDLLASLRA